MSPLEDINRRAEIARRFIRVELEARPVPDEEYVLVQGRGNIGYYQGVFHCVDLANPLRSVAVMPLRLATRIQGFTGGTVKTVRGYLESLLKLL